MSMSTKDFTECVKQARKGDSEAFANLYSLVYKELYHIALYSLNSPDDAADAVSDTVLDAFATLKALKSPEAFKSWIVRILYAKIKKRQREYIESRAGSSLEDVEQEILVETDFDNLVLREEFGKLDEKDRLVLSLNVIGGYTSEEIGKICGEKAATVRSQLSRAKRKLKERLLI